MLRINHWQIQQNGRSTMSVLIMKMKKNGSMTCVLFLLFQQMVVIIRRQSYVEPTLFSKLISANPKLQDTKNTMNKDAERYKKQKLFQGRGDPWALYKFPASPQTWIATSCHQLPFVQLMQKRKTWIRTIRPITLWGQKRVKLNHCIQSQNSCKPAFGPRHFPQMSKDTAPTHFFDVFSDSTT